MSRGATYIVVRDETGKFRIVQGVHVEEGIHCSSLKRAEEMASKLNAESPVETAPNMSGGVICQY